MNIRRINLIALALASLAPLGGRPIWAMESTFEISGTYDAAVDGMTARLTLNEGGSAQYVVRWLLAQDSNTLGKLTVEGRWARQGHAVTLTFPDPSGSGRVEYEISPCLSHKSFGKAGCSPGLHVVASDLPSNRTLELWKTEFLVL
jgi:hypothetical protein